jgi:2-hydroxychromene-2-carboxylate isomerase
VSADGEAQPVFYYDLGSVGCYLVAEQISAARGIGAEWEPVLAAELGWVEPEPDRTHVERLGRSLTLQPFRWPAELGVDTRGAMLAATYAKQAGRAVTFSLAAFRQAFAGGRDLSDTDTVLIAAAACEMHPTAVLKGISLRSVAARLERAGARASTAGVRALPAIQVGAEVFSGEQALADAVAALEHGG